MTTDFDEQVLAAVAAVGLPGSLHELPATRLTAQEADALVAAVEEHGIAGMALAAARAGSLRLPAAAVDALAGLHGSEAATSHRLEQELVAVSALLQAAGIASRALGDVPAAHLDHRQPGSRAVARLDLLLRPGDVDRAVSLLRREGWQLLPGGAGPDTGSGATLTSPSGLPVHVQTAIRPGPARPADDERALWADGREFRIGGRRLTALGDESRLLHVCCQAASSHRPPLVAQRDVAEAVLFGTWDRARVMALAAAWHAEEELALAVRVAWRCLAIADVTSLSVWAGVDRPDRNGRGRRDGAPVGARPQPRPSIQRRWPSRLLARLS